MAVFNAAHIANMSGIEDPFAQVRQFLVGAEGEMVIEDDVVGVASLAYYLFYLGKQSDGVALEHCPAGIELNQAPGSHG